jgi:hypothetical protein
MVNHLDRNLFIGGEVKEVYDELVKTIDEDFLRFDMVSTTKAKKLNQADFNKVDTFIKKIKTDKIKK